ncbi:MAG: hypothetical protein IIY74_04295, partial [Firmicutes bacterium]|nr:hypothetical protein [Bacillota bacterium]
MKKITASLLSLAMILSALAFAPAAAFAADDEIYVLMNIPYGEFYEAEGISGVDGVTSATKSKTRAGNLAAGTYHKDPEGSDISGITFPVFVSDMSVLEGLTQVTDDASLSITVTLRGQESTTVYEGRDALFEN